MNSNESQEQQKQANQAVFIGIGEDITSQYLDVLNYCKEKKSTNRKYFCSSRDK